MNLLFVVIELLLCTQIPLLFYATLYIGSHAGKLLPVYAILHEAIGLPSYRRAVFTDSSLVLDANAADLLPAGMAPRLLETIHAAMDRGPLQQPAPVDVREVVDRVLQDARVRADLREVRERIFDKSEIIPMKREGLSQIGLGLAFCKMVVEARGGQIRVERNEPRGSIFVVQI